MKAGWVYGGYVDPKKLLPRPSDTRPCGSLAEPDHYLVGNERQVSLIELFSKPEGYRLIAGWSLIRPYDRWE